MKWAIRGLAFSFLIAVAIYMTVQQNRHEDSLRAERKKVRQQAEQLDIVRASLQESMRKNLQQRDALNMMKQHVEDQTIPKKRQSAPSEKEIAAALETTFKMLSSRTHLSRGEVIAVVGRNIEPVMEALLNNKMYFSHGNTSFIIAGETAGSNVVEQLQEKYQRHKVFEVNEGHPTPDIRANIATDSVDVFIVWDLENGLNAALAYKSLTFEANKMLRAHAGVSSRIAVFVTGKKEPPSKGILAAEQLKLVDAAKSTDSDFDYSVLLLERGGGVSANTKWRGIGSMEVADPLQFMEKCRSPAEHMHGLDVLLRIVGDVLEECGITYWLDSGTLLGAYRFNAYNPMEDDHDVVVDHDEFIEHTHKFRRIINERFEEINRQARFIAIDGKPEHYKGLIAQLFMSKDGSVSGPQIDLLPAKYDSSTSTYDLVADYFRNQTPEGFKKSVIFSNTAVSKWKTKHGYLRSLPILGREYPAPYDVEGYSAVWYSKSDFMNHMILRQMKENKEGHDKYCSGTISKVFAPRNPAAVMQMVARMKELFPTTFDGTACPLCKCTVDLCYVPKVAVN